MAPAPGLRPGVGLMPIILSSDERLITWTLYFLGMIITALIILWFAGVL
jgi:hypothetical protein